MIIGIDASRAVTGQRTGTEAYAYFLIQSLIPLASHKGHQLRLYFNHSPSPGLFLQNELVEQVVIPWPRLWTHLRLAWELQQRPPDIFFTPAHVIPFTYRGLAAATVHDLGYYHFPEAHPRQQLYYLRWSTRHNGRRSQRIIADSQATKNDLVRFEGIDPAKVEVVYPGIDPMLQPVQGVERLTAVQQKYQIRAPYLLFLSTLQPRKNLVRLIEAYGAAHLPHQLVLAGKSGWQARPIHDSLAALPSPLSSQIILPGFIEDSDKAALLSGATAVLYPSLYEGFGFPALEAQACGTAVLCANTSSLPEIVGDSALLVDPLNTAAITTAIRRMATNESLRAELIQKGFENVKRFKWEKTAVQVLSVLEASGRPRTALQGELRGEEDG
jgi:glycosyltransferase involved in cell wall biosynthesis